MGLRAPGGERRRGDASLAHPADRRRAILVRGLAIIRGAPLAVVDLAALLGAGDGERGARFVTLRAGPRHVAVEVDMVLGFGALEPSALHALPPLLSEALPDQVQKLGALDGHTLALLDALRLLPDEALQALPREGCS
jgi:purine-binding chemotaxis protein CheW